MKMNSERIVLRKLPYIWEIVRTPPTLRVDPRIPSSFLQGSSIKLDT
jgi:hypothetical protein